MVMMVMMVMMTMIMTMMVMVMMVMLVMVMVMIMRTMIEQTDNNMRMQAHADCDIAGALQEEILRNHGQFETYAYARTTATYRH